MAETYEFKIAIDFGFGHLTKCGGWLTSNLNWMLSTKNNWQMVLSTGNKENIDMLKRHEVDAAWVNQRVLAEMAAKGEGMFAGEGKDEDIYAVITLPHIDQFVMASLKSSPFKSYEDILLSERPVIVLTGPDDGSSLTTFAFRKMLEAYGRTFEEWTAVGGKLVGYEFEDDLLYAMAREEGDAIFYDNFMTEGWWNLDAKVDLNYLSLPELAAKHLEENGFTTRMVEPDGKSGFSEAICAIDASYETLVMRADAKEEVVRCCAEIALTKRKEIEIYFPLLNPIDPKVSMIKCPVEEEQLVKSGCLPIHPVALKKYREAGLNI